MVDGHLGYFFNAAAEFGLTSRARSDKGGENVDIPWYMLHHQNRGPSRGSHITGGSVNNQQIERRWQDLFAACTHLFYHPFYSIHLLSTMSNEHHMAALQSELTRV